MKSSRRSMGAMLLVSACLAPEDQPVQETGGVQQPPGARQSVEAVVLLGGQPVQLRTRPMGDEWLDVEVHVHGMALCATVDEQGQLAELDGFSISQGQDTWVTQPDRQLLSVLLDRLEHDAQFAELEPSVLRVVSHWSQTPDPTPLQRAIYGRKSLSLCRSFGRYEVARHDDLGSCDGSTQRFGGCSSWVEVGTRYSPTHYWSGGRWTTEVPDHQAGLFETGECFGNCGFGCPRGAQTLTRDCLDHDHCVRNGHSLISPSCLDEFLAAADDELFAPLCPGT